MSANFPVQKLPSSLSSNVNVAKECGQDVSSFSGKPNASTSTLPSSKIAPKLESSINNRLQSPRNESNDSLKAPFLKPNPRNTSQKREIALNASQKRKNESNESDLAKNTVRKSQHEQTPTNKQEEFSGIGRSVADVYGEEIEDHDLEEFSFAADVNERSNGDHVQSTTSPSAQKQAGNIDILKPVVRPPFPTPVKDQTPIIGLSSNTLLRTCFRIGEARNAGCQAVRRGQDVIIELYARVANSWREEKTGKQHFVFSDMFHDHPPYLNGCYVGWKGVDLWDYDSSAFLEENRRGRMCRCIGKVKRENHEWTFTILNIWESAWEDIQWCQGIVSS